MNKYVVEYLGDYGKMETIEADSVRVWENTHALVFLRKDGSVVGIRRFDKTWSVDEKNDPTPIKDAKIELDDKVQRWNSVTQELQSGRVVGFDDNGILKNYYAVVQFDNGPRQMYAAYALKYANDVAAWMPQDLDGREVWIPA